MPYGQVCLALFPVNYARLIVPREFRLIGIILVIPLQTIRGINGRVESGTADALIEALYDPSAPLGTCFTYNDSLFR